MMTVDQAFEKSLLMLEELGFKGLEDHYKVMATIWAIEAEVNNGGFDQLFYNSAGDLAFYGPQAFSEIGATNMAEIIREANSIFGVSGPPQDAMKRQEILLSFGEKHVDKINRLDLAFYDYPDDVQNLLEKYVNLHF